MEGRGRTLPGRRGAARGGRTDGAAGGRRAQGAGRLRRGPGRKAEPGLAAKRVGGPGGLQIPSDSREPRQDRPGGAMEGSPIPVLTVPTVPYEDQRPAGGGGLRRPTGLFEGQRNYLPNFIQSVLSSIDLRDRQGCTMVVGSDGRYFSRTATEIVVQMAAANGVSDLPRPTLASRRAAALPPLACRPLGAPHPHLSASAIPGPFLPGPLEGTCLVALSSPQLPAHVPHLPACLLGLLFPSPLKPSLRTAFTTFPPPTSS